MTSLRSYRWHTDDPDHDFQLAWVPGTGDTPYLFGGQANRRPTHITGFYISTTPVTQALWARVMGSNPAARPEPLGPVENVSWKQLTEAGGFLDRLNASDIRIALAGEGQESGCSQIVKEDKQMIKTVSTGIAIVVALGLFAEAAGQSIDRGTLSGTVFSAGATVPNLSQAFVTTTPDDRAFVLTQVCTTHPNALRLNAGAIIGDIPLERSTNCTQYIPGIAIPPRTNINCFDHAGARGNLRCMLTGVLTPSVVPPPAAGVKASFDPAVSFTGSSASTSPRKLIETRSFDHGWEADMGALDFLSKSLQDEPDSTGYTFIYGARRGYRNDVVKRMECMKNYLLQRRGIPAGRLRVINGGYREHATVELWVAPNGSAAPVPRPAVSPKNVRFKQGGTRYTCNV